jgi:hypothetical protein
MNEANRIERELMQRFGVRIWELGELDRVGATRVSGHCWRCSDGSLLEVHLVTGGSPPGGYIVNAID